MTQALHHAEEWAVLTDKFSTKLKAEAQANKQPWNSRSEVHAVRMALGAYKLRCFTERLRDQYEAPWLKLSDLEARRLYLMNKHHWTLSQVQELNEDADFLLVLHQELVELKLDAVEAFPVRGWASNYGLAIEFQAHFSDPAA